VAHCAAVPLAYAIDPDKRLVTITGEYSGAVEWQDVLTRIHLDAEHQPGFTFLRDLRAGTTPVDAATVMEIAKVVRRFWPLLQPARVAILARSEEDAPALVAQALADAAGLPLRMFINPKEALAWLAEGAQPTERH
jgi:hypothetical protein